MQQLARVISRPHRVHFAGWESTTTRLQQAGWELSAEQDIRRCSLNLVMRHQALQMYGLCEARDYDFFRRAHAPSSAMATYAEDSLEFNVRYMASHVTVQTMGDFSAYRPIDAYPQMVSGEYKDLEDFNIFAVPLARTEEFIVDPDQVGRLLELIKEAQSPRQAEIRENLRRRESREGMHIDAAPRQQFHAQVLSLAA